MMEQKNIYTVGHSTHPAEYFLELLNAHLINCIIDVRSVAASRFNPQYNKKSLEEFLKKNGITYLHFDKEFGARQIQPEVLDEKGQVDFEKVRASKDFKSGVKRVETGLEKGFVPALMCAEADPLDCHRFSMVSPALRKKFILKHILKDKSLISQEELEEKLVEKYKKKLPAKNLFDKEMNHEEKIQYAFKLSNDAIGFSINKRNNK